MGKSGTKPIDKQVELPTKDELMQEIEAQRAAEAQVEEGPIMEDPSGNPVYPNPEPPSTLEGLAEGFRANESINESGFAEGIVVAQEMPNLDGDFGSAAQIASPESHMDDIRLAQTTAVLESVGIDSGTVLADNKIEDFEFAQTISKAGYKILEEEATGPAAQTLRAEDLTQENHPEAYAKALEFGESMNLDLEGNPEIVVGLMAVEVSGNDSMMHSILEAQRAMDPEMQAQMEMAVPTEAEMIGDTMAADPNAGSMKI